MVFLVTPWPVLTNRGIAIFAVWGGGWRALALGVLVCVQACVCAGVRVRERVRLCVCVCVRAFH